MALGREGKEEVESLKNFEKLRLTTTSNGAKSLENIKMNMNKAIPVVSILVKAATGREDD
mgnify:CR=1 FL=1